MADILPGEVIAHQIFIRLPVKSLVQCRCVCKLWNSLSYNIIFSQNPNRIFDDDDDDDYVICMNDYVGTKDSSTCPYGLSILSRNNFSSETRIDINNNNNVVPYPLLISSIVLLIGSVNGLVCMAIHSYDCDQFIFILWNPIIRIFKKVIIPKHLGMNIYQCRSILYGFGWDMVTDDYKLIIAEAASRMAAVYSCKTDCWSSSTMSIDNSISLHSLHNPPCVIVNGSPYWKSKSGNVIFKFDISNNKFTFVNVDENVHDPIHIHGISTYSLINLNDRLALIMHKCFNYKKAAVYCCFDEEDGHWSKMYTIFDSSVNICTKQLCFKYGGELVFDRKKQLYDPKSDTIKYCHRGSSACCLGKWHNNKIKCRDCGGSVINGYSYTPSLLALQGMKAIE